MYDPNNRPDPLAVVLKGMDLSIPFHHQCQGNICAGGTRGDYWK